MQLVPAYGRDYKSKKQVQADLDAGRDFIVADMSSPYDGKPCNAVDLKASGVRQVKVRFGGLRKVGMFPLR